MKILQINKFYYPLIGGIEKIVQQIAEGLNGKDGFEVEVLCCDYNKKKKNDIVNGVNPVRKDNGIELSNGVKVWRAKSWGIFWGMPLSFDFLKLFKKLSQKTDIIAFHHPFPLGDLAIFLFRPKIELIVHYHSDVVRQKVLEIFFRPLILNTLNKAEKIVVSNPNLIKSSLYLKKFKEKCRVVPFGVDFEKIENNLNEEEIKRIKKKYGNFILFVGRLNYYKGIDYLIEAMKEIEAKLVIIGEGAKKDSLELKIKDLRLEDKIHFLPFQKEGALINFYKACSVFVLPSIFRSEAFGIVLIEAMACGTPIVSTELGTGTSWVNVNNKTGFVVPLKNSQTLAQAIKKIIENKELAQEMGQNALKRVKEKFTLEKMLKGYEDLYGGV